MLVQLACQRFRGVHAVQQPEGMLQLIPQLRRGKGEFLLCCHRVQKLVNRGVMDKAFVLIRGKKLVQVERVFFCLAVDLYAPGQLIPDDLAHLIGEHIQLRQRAIRVFFLSGPVAFAALFIRVCPVIDGLIRKFVIRQRLEGGSGQMQRESALNMVEGHVRLVGVNALMRLVDDQHVPFQIHNLLQLVVLPAEIDGALQILQGYKLDQPHRLIIRILRPLLRVLIVRGIGHHQWPVLNPVHIADKEVSGLPPKESIIIRIPGIGDSRPVGDDQHPFRGDLLNEIIYGQRLPEARFRVPEELRPFMVLPVCDSLPYRVCLFIPQVVRNHFMQILHNPAIAAEFIETFPGVRRRNMEPFVPIIRVEVFVSLILWLLNPLLPKVRVKVGIPEGVAGAVIKGSCTLPFLLGFNAGRMGLLINPLIHILFGITNLDVSIMIGNPRSRIGINHRHNLGSGLDLALYALCHLCHLLYMSLDEADLFIGKAVLFVQLLINRFDRC